MSVSLLEISNLRVEFAARRQRVVAVDGVNLTVGSGETVGLVGESGSGKSTVGNAVLGLVPCASGRITLAGKEFTRQLAVEHVQAVFQDPRGSLNPSRTIGAALAEPLRVRRRLCRSEAEARVVSTLGQVGLSSDTFQQFPGQLSGGQRQRVAIARALVLEPDLVICDEPTSALDLSVQAQVLNLLLELQEQLGLAYLFISHDIDVVRHMSHRIAVLQSGRILEAGPVEQVMADPSHPYTRALLAAARYDTPEVG